MYVHSLSFFFFKQKTAYEMRISDWSSDVCSSDLRPLAADLEVLDLVEITPQPRRRLACGTIHDGDEARMRYHRVSGRWSRPRHPPPAWHRRPACPRSAAARRKIGRAHV